MNFLNGDKRISGLVLPLSALRSSASPAVGEYPDLVLLGELAASWGFKLVQLLPVNDSGGQSSPYSALSAFALHPLYVRLSSLPEASLPGIPPLVAEFDAFQAEHAGDERFRYGPFLSRKLESLERIFLASYPDGQLEGGDFRAWLAANPWIKAYAVYCELKRRNEGRPWWEWSEHRDPDAGLVERLWDDPGLRAGTRFFAWLQMRADGQFYAAAQSLRGQGVDLMGDIPILIGEDSVEVWSDRGIFRRELKAGAPPDMYAELGQNWGCPIYDWGALAARGYDFWRDRLRLADRYYSAYRIDHVLGFFRIWALGEEQESGYLGRFVPDAFASREELAGLGFSAERLRWLSQPHVPTRLLLDAAGGDATAAMEAAKALLDRIGNEELFLFKPGLRGERDIRRASAEGIGGWGGEGLDPRVRDSLLGAFRDRALFEFEPGRFCPSWSYRSSTAWKSLSEEERGRLEALFGEKRREGEAVWEENGRNLLRLLKETVPMLPCAEDLGSVPPCVPRVLEGLGILGLRVLRWARAWDEPGQPFTPPEAYPALSVACGSVHDSSTLREWWENEADRLLVWRLAQVTLSRNARLPTPVKKILNGPPPESLEPEAAEALLGAIAASGSLITAHPFQDILALGTAFRQAEAGNERINVPGTSNEWNWGWRLPARIEDIAADEALAEAARRLALREER